MFTVAIVVVVVIIIIAIWLLLWNKSPTDDEDDRDEDEEERPKKSKKGSNKKIKKLYDKLHKMFIENPEFSIEEFKKIAPDNDAGDFINLKSLYDVKISTGGDVNEITEDDYTLALND
jgi:hypothetical protein